MSHPLTKEVRRQLAAYAAKITTPGYAPGVPTAITAAELRERGTTHDRRGQPLQAGQSYYLAPAPAVNHQRRLQAAYEAGGWPACEVYLQPFMTKEYAAKQLAARAAEAAPAEPAIIDVAPVAEAAPTAWLDEAGPVVMGIDLATRPAESFIIGQLYEAGHPGPLGECPAARPCAGSCGSCLN
jgi:hypothetical protein